MDSERFEKLERLFHSALELQDAERDAFLQREARDDPLLRKEVTRLLKAEAAERKSGLVESLLSAADVEPPRMPEIASGQWVGPYRLIRELGRGGTGVVFEAEEPTSRRMVAIKLFHSPRGDDPAYADALLREAKILAKLNHPAIASIYAAGHTDNGRPYFVMELVEGQRLDKFARRLSRGERLQLFLKMCDGVHYAHRSGVIHRDLKPSNVLVRRLAVSDNGHGDDDVILKILDFGLAKLVDRDATLSLSGFSEGWGTLPYMSPEQRHGTRVGRLTDVYALGVILFKLMTDKLPYPVEGLPLPEAWYRIEHDTPQRPSRLDPALRGDLETIILNAIADEPSRRYQSAAELGDDVRRYLSDQRPMRRAPSVFREIGRFAKRNKGLVATVTALFLGLVATTVGTYSGLIRARKAEEELQREAKIKNALVEYVISERQALDETQSDTEDAPSVATTQAAAHTEDAGAADGAVSDDETDPIWDVRRRNPLEMQRREAKRLLVAGRYEEAAEEYEQLVQVASLVNPGENWFVAVLRSEYGECLTHLRRFEEAEVELKAGYEGLLRTRGVKHNFTFEAVERLIALYKAWRKLDYVLHWQDVRREYEIIRQSP